MNAPQPTQRKSCPFLTAGTITVSNIVDADGRPPGAKLTPIQCLGDACHMWIHDPRLPSTTGDCSMKVGAYLNANVAGMVGQLTNLVALSAKKLGVEGIEIIDPNAPAPKTN